MIKFKKRYFVCYILAIIFNCASIHGATLVVPDNYETIQAAINEASWGDTIIVEDGVYTGVENRNISFNGKILTLKSRNGQEYTTIDCQYLDRGFTLTKNEGNGTIIDGFTIQNGYASEGGGGIYCENSSPSIKNCKIINCEANGAGGGLYAEDSSLLLDSCIIESNKACALGGGIYFWNGFPHVKNCRVTNNMIESSSDCQAPLGLNGHGGGIYYRYNIIDNIEDLAIFEDTIISGNSTYFYGGGIYLNMTTPHSCFITGCTLSSNQASEGGGLYGGDENTLVSNTIFENNNATGYGGGGINKSNSVFMDCKIRNNTSDGGGGGLYSSWAGSNPQLINCEFSGNIAYGYTGGGGICLNNCASPKIMGCEFYNNSAMDGKGGGISLHYHAYSNEEKRGEIINCIFIDNYASEEGGAILFETSCSTEIPFYFINNTITQNLGFNSGGIYSASELHVQNSIVYYNSPNDIIGNNGLTTASYCNTTELMEGEGNMSELPEFIGNGDFHLSWNSPCIDRGTMLNAPDSDMDGDKRPEGEGIDIGADEFVDSDFQEAIIILTDASPNATVEADSIAKIYGTNGANNITVGSGADVELINFTGENSIVIQSQSSFSAYRTGAMVILDGSDGTKIKLPATMTRQSIIFNDVEKILVIDSGCIMIGDQIVNLDSVVIE